MGLYLEYVDGDASEAEEGDGRAEGKGQPQSLVYISTPVKLPQRDLCKNRKLQSLFARKQHFYFRIPHFFRFVLFGELPPYFEHHTYFSGYVCTTATHCAPCCSSIEHWKNASFNLNVRGATNGARCD